MVSATGDSRPGSTTQPSAPGGSSEFQCTDQFLAQQLSAALKKRVTVKNVVKCRAKAKCRQEKLDPICNAARLNRKQRLDIEWTVR